MIGNAFLCNYFRLLGDPIHLPLCALSEDALDNLCVGALGDVARKASLSFRWVTHD